MFAGFIVGAILGAIAGYAFRGFISREKAKAVAAKAEFEKAMSKL